MPDAWLLFVFALRGWFVRRVGLWNFGSRMWPNLLRAIPVWLVAATARDLNHSPKEPLNLASAGPGGW